MFQSNSSYMEYQGNNDHVMPLRGNYTEKSLLFLKSKKQEPMYLHNK